MVISFSSALLRSAQTNSKALMLVQHVMSLVNIGKHKLYVNSNQLVLFEQIMEHLVIYEEVIKKYADVSDKVKPDFFVVIDKSGNIMQFEKTYNVNSNFKIIRYNNFNKVTVKVNGPTRKYECEFIDMKNYYSYVCDNMKIMLEDKVSDGAFLKSIIKAYLGDEFDMESLDIEGCAGCVSRNLRAVTKRNRIFSFVDSDKKHKKLIPSDGKDIEKRKLMGLAQQYGYKILFLKKREIENYIPDELLKSIEPNHIYFKFNNDQKAFFDLKFGLKVRDCVISEVYDLYREFLTDDDKLKIRNCKIELTKQDREKVLEGIGNKVLIDGFGKDVYKLFFENITKKQFDMVDCYNEFNEVVKWVKRYS